MAVRYMGSKKALAPEIADVITRRHPNSTVLDVFAGMCAVGSQISTRHRLFTNDIHAYATTIASALFTGPSTGPTSINAREELLSNFTKNKRALERAVRRRLEREDQFCGANRVASQWRRGLAINNAELNRPPARKLDGLSTIADYRKNGGLFPYCLMTSYFASTYFGIRQAIEIDSLRYAIDRAPLRRRDHYLAALIDAASHCAAAPGDWRPNKCDASQRSGSPSPRWYRRQSGT
jgi:adenine-specific DNA-methyltransferase